MPGLQLTLFVVEARGNFKGRFSGTYIYMEKVNVLFVILLCYYQGHKPQYYNWTYCTNMYIIPVWKKNSYRGFITYISFSLCLPETTENIPF